MPETAWTDARIDEFAKNVERDFRLVHDEIAALRAEGRTDIAGVRGEMTGLRGEMTGLRGDIAEVRGEISTVRGEISALNGRVTQIRLGQSIALVGVVGALAASSL